MSSLSSGLLPSQQQHSQQKRINSDFTKQTTKYKFHCDYKENSNSFCNPIPNDMNQRSDNYKAPQSDTNKNVTHSCHVISAAQIQAHFIQNPNRDQQQFQSNNSYHEYRQTPYGAQIQQNSLLFNSRSLSNLSGMYNMRFYR